VSGGPAAGARDTCLWLARQAACDRGLVQRLVRQHGDFEAVLAQPRARLARSLKECAPPATECGPSGPDEGLVTWCDDDYPPGLRDLHDPPPALYLRGARWRARLNALNQAATVAIVGARRPSPYGLEMSSTLGVGLVRAGVNVVSGMALGIDAAAHVEALRWIAAMSGAEPVGDALGVCAGVLGAGVRQVVPRTNQRLFADMYERGLLISDVGWDLPPFPWRFPARNRIIAALADAVVVVEGRATSGALYTAEFALEASRDVLAVPGEAGRPLAAGPHLLLRDGAHLCESPDDVLALLPDGAWRRVPAGDAARGGARGGVTVRPDTFGGDEPAGRVLHALRDCEQSTDQLAAALDLPVRVVLGALASLEVEGLAEGQLGGRFRATRQAGGRRP
jgi:DNA processing protein